MARAKSALDALVLPDHSGAMKKPLTNKRNLLSILLPLCALGGIFGASNPAIAQSASDQEEAAGLPEGITGETLAMAMDTVLDGSELEALIDILVTETTVTGEPVEGWSDQGVFLPKHLANRHGSMFGNVVYGKTGMPSILRYGPEAIGLPEGYSEFVLSEGSDLPVIETALVGLQEGIWLETRTRIIRVGNAVCYSGPIALALHTNSAPETLTEDDLGTIALFYGMMKAMDDLDMCLVYSEQSDGTLTSSAYSRDGKPYTVINADITSYSVHPASESAELVANSALTQSFLNDLESE